MTDLLTDRLQIGEGFNTATSVKGGRVVAFDPDRGGELLTTAGGPIGEGGQRLSYRLTEVTQTQQLKTALSISASASCGIGIFSADASFSFMSTGKFSSYSNFLVVEVLVRNPSQVLEQALLTPEALEYLRTDMSRFYDFAGDEYVYGRSTGGRLYAIVEFKAKSNEQQQETRAAISAAVSGFGGGEARFASSLAQLEAVSETNIFLVRDGGEAPIPDLAALRAAALSFNTLVAEREQQGAPVVASVFTTGYGSVGNLPRNFPTLEEFENQRQAIGVIAQLLDRCYRLLADLTYASLHPDEFEQFSRDQFQATWGENENNIAMLLSAAFRVKTDSSQRAPSPPALPTWRPTRKQSVVVEVVNPERLEPQPGEWAQVVNWKENFIGRVRAGQRATVVLRGKWRVREGSQCIDVTGYTGGVRYAARISLWAADRTTLLWSSRYKGVPVDLPAPVADSFVSVLQEDTWGERYTDAERAPCAPPAEALLLTPE